MLQAPGMTSAFARSQRRTGSRLAQAAGSTKLVKDPHTTPRLKISRHANNFVPKILGATCTDILGNTGTASLTGMTFLLLPMIGMT
jgi:hypothetical protein